MHGTCAHTFVRTYIYQLHIRLAISPIHVIYPLLNYAFMLASLKHYLDYQGL